MSSETRSPLISIITASFNSGDTLATCLQSVQAQTFSEWEHIVIDGGSTDGSVELLHAQHDPRLRWISERDKGIADAMNKGIAMARGEWLLFLQADDRLCAPDALAATFRCLKDPASVHLFDTWIADNAGNWRLWKCQPGRIWRKMPGSHQGMLFPRGTLAEVFHYDTSYRVAMDYDLVFRLAVSGIPFKAFSTPFSIASGEGISGRKDLNNLRRRLLEERRIHLTRTRSFIRRLFYNGYWSLYLPYRITGTCRHPATSQGSEQ